MDVPDATIALSMLANPLPAPFPALAWIGALGKAAPCGRRGISAREEDGLRHAALKGLRPEKKPALIRRSPMT